MKPPVRPALLPCEFSARRTPSLSGQVSLHDDQGRWVGTIEPGEPLNRESERAAIRRTRRQRTRRRRLPRGHFHGVWWALPRGGWQFVGAHGPQPDGVLTARQRRQFNALSFASAMVRAQARRRGLPGLGFGWDSGVIEQLNVPPVWATSPDELAALDAVVASAGPAVASHPPDREDDAGRCAARRRHVRVTITPTRGPGRCSLHRSSAMRSGGFTAA